MATTRRNDAPARRPLSELMDRQPPFDLQAEIGVLGSIVLLPDVLDDVVMLVRPDDFYDDAHRKLYVHMTALHEAGKKIDDTLLINRLKSSGDFEAVGGAAYLSKSSTRCPTPPTPPTTPRSSAKRRPIAR
jgi:replicative DNA helicase